MGTYRDKNKRQWRYDFRMAGKRYTSRWYSSETEAAKAEAARRARILTALSGEWPTFSALAADWIEALASRGVGEHYMRQAHAQFNRWLTPIANRPPADITPLEVQRLLQRCAAETSAVNANAVRKILRACFSHGTRLGGLQRNPAAMVRPWPEPPRRADEVEAIPTTHLRAVLLSSPSWLRRLLTVQALTGARWIEIARLRPEDCHLDATPPHVVLRHRKGGERERRRVLPTPAAQALREQTREGGVWLWPGRPATQHRGYPACLKHLHRACDRAEVPRYSFHAVRRWAATTAMLAGVSDRIVAEFLGHADATVVHRYQRVEDAVVGTISDALARELAR